MLDAPTTASIGTSKIRLKAGFSISASVVHPGRDTEPVVSSIEEGFHRAERIDGSSFFIPRRIFGNTHAGSLATPPQDLWNHSVLPEIVGVRSSVV